MQPYLEQVEHEKVLEFVEEQEQVVETLDEVHDILDDEVLGGSNDFQDLLRQGSSWVLPLAKPELPSN